jgi:N-formylglutamate amidohydrolase
MVVYNQKKDSRLILSMPHSGKEIPADLVPLVNLDLEKPYVQHALQYACDSCVPDMTGFYQYDQASKIWTTLPRLVIDVNRGKQDVDALSLEGATGCMPHGLVWRSSLEEKAEDVKDLLTRPYTQEQLDRLIEIAYDPYISFLEQEIPRLHQLYGQVTLVELHSMPAVIPGKVKEGRHKGAYLATPAQKGYLKDRKVPEVLISDRGKCGEPIIETIYTIFGDLGQGWQTRIKEDTL